MKYINIFKNISNYTQDIIITGIIILIIWVILMILYKLFAREKVSLISFFIKILFFVIMLIFLLLPPDKIFIRKYNFDIEKDKFQIGENKEKYLVEFEKKISQVKEKPSDKNLSDLNQKINSIISGKE